MDIRISENDKQVLRWIKRNLSSIITTALAGKKTMVTEDWLAAIACRETRNLIRAYAIVKTTNSFEQICELMIGDHGHGYSFWQIDDRSYPEFIKSGKWKNPLNACNKAIDCLQEKASYITTRHSEWNNKQDLENAITAAYNCGQGNVVKALDAKKNADFFTAGSEYSKPNTGDYSAVVRAYRNYYLTIL